MKKSNFYSWDQVGLFLSPPEVGNLLGLSRAKAYQLFHCKNFPSFSIGKRLVVDRSKLKQWLNEQVNVKQDIL